MNRKNIIFFILWNCALSITPLAQGTVVEQMKAYAKQLDDAQKQIAQSKEDLTTTYQTITDQLYLPLGAAVYASAKKSDDLTGMISLFDQLPKMLGSYAGSNTYVKQVETYTGGLIPAVAVRAGASLLTSEAIKAMCLTDVQNALKEIKEITHYINSTLGQIILPFSKARMLIYPEPGQYYSKIYTDLDTASAEFGKAKDRLNRLAQALSSLSEE